MGDKRHKDANWNCGEASDVSFAAAQLAVLMDIRDEMKELNRLLRCPNFTAIPGTLRDIKRNTTKARRKRKRTT